MGMTIAEKILAHASGSQQVSAGEIVWAKVDVAMMDDLRATSFYCKWVE